MKTYGIDTDILYDYPSQCFPHTKCKAGYSVWIKKLQRKWAGSRVNYILMNTFKESTAKGDSACSDLTRLYPFYFFSSLFAYNN